ncbi:MAG: universal stress protein [Geminicoccaceae bacterium]|nr:MAG: universal stress protein [Geminicoccaceae bacterium]
MYKQILVPIDVNDVHSYEKALPTAAKLVETFEAKLHVMSVLPDFGMPMVGHYFPRGFRAKATAAIGEEMEKILDRHLPRGMALDKGVVQGTIYREILRIAQDLPADLIVMGSHRPALSDYLLGPNAARVVRHAHCSVMVVRGTV